MLLRPHGAVIGALGDFYNLNMQLKFNELSDMTFKYPKLNHGKRTMFYDNLVGDKLVQVDPYGVFIVKDQREVSEEGVQIKEVECVSREYELSSKRFFIAEGTYNLWDPLAPENSMLGIIFDGLNWKVGHVSASLIGRYRTFSQTDGFVYDFLIGDLQDKYGCICDFDTYNRTVDVIDVDEPVVTMPVYLSRKNLIKTEDLREDISSLKTVLSVRGADEVSIRNVNPTGDNKIYNLDYYISNGDLPAELVQKWREWENTIFSRQPYYTSVVALRNAANSRRLSLEAELVELNNDLKVLDNTRATFLQMLESPSSAESTVFLDENGISSENATDYFNSRLEETAAEYSEIEVEIADLKLEVDAVIAERDEHDEVLAEINTELKLKNYFSNEDLAILNSYFKEDEFADNTFAVFDVDIDNTGSYNKLSNAPLVFSDVTWTDVECEGEHRIAAITGGRVSISENDVIIEANIIRGTLDHANGEVVCSLYLGAGSDCSTDFPSGNLTYSATSDYDDDAILSAMTKNEDTVYSADKSVSHTTYYYTGGATIPGKNAKVHFTRNATEYQQYSVEQDLYDHAKECMEEISWPGYEFNIGSGNFVFAEKFEPFKNAIQLGCNVYLELGDDQLLEPMLIEIHINFDDPDDFDLIFSNYFQRPDGSNSLKNLLGKASSTSSTIDMSKYSFKQNANTTTWVKEMVERGFDAAMVQISSGKDQLVSIDKAGIRVDSANGTSKIYLNNGMIALLDKKTNTVKMAMGHFMNEVSGLDFVGILADVIGGTLVAGQNLIIECPDPNGGVMQFKVDSSGVLINNGRMYMKSEKGAMAWDPSYGFFSGTSEILEAADDGSVSPTCIDSETGEMIFDDDGFPKDINVWIGIDGKSYFRGNIYAENGVFKGQLSGNTIGLYDENGVEAGSINIEEASSADHKIELRSNGAALVWAEIGDVYIRGEHVSLAGTVGVVSGNNLYPASKSYTLGVSGMPWNTLYSDSCSCCTSDLSKKTSLEYDLNKYNDFFDALQPLRFKFVDGESDRYHTGFISQDVESALTTHNLTSQDFAGFVKAPCGNDGDYNYMLRYEEFIALNTWQIQELKKKVSEMEAKLT